MSVADYCGWSTPTANKIIHRVSAAIASLHTQYIKFPSTEHAIRKEQDAFYRIARFPKVIGAIDCTHVPLVSMVGDNVDERETFRNRKGYFSINVQTIINSNLEITDIVARWPGSTHDSTIWNNSFRKAQFEAGSYGDAVLVADGGYASTPYMMTPLENPRTAAEQLYNESQIRTRNPVERSYGIWKRRFPALALGLRVKLNKALIIIMATAVLHNILRASGEQVPPDDPELNLPHPWDDLLVQAHIPIGNAQPSLRNRTRDNLVANYFHSLV